MASKTKTDRHGKGESSDDKPVKIDKWDGAAVKNALDDAAKNVMVDHFGYVESHKMMDGRLLICTGAVGFAVFALVWDYLHPFPMSRPVLVLCVVSYFLMMVVLTVYTTFKERGCFLSAHDKDKAGIDPDNVWNLASQLKRYDDQYTLFMTYIDGETGQVRAANFTKCIADFFDENGYICCDLFDPQVKKLANSLGEEKKGN